MQKLASHFALRCCGSPIKYGQRLENDFSPASVHVLGTLTVVPWNPADLTTCWPGLGYKARGGPFSLHNLLY